MLQKLSGNKAHRGHVRKQQNCSCKQPADVLSSSIAHMSSAYYHISHASCLQTHPMKNHQDIRCSQTLSNFHNSPHNSLFLHNNVYEQVSHEKATGHVLFYFAGQSSDSFKGSQFLPQQNLKGLRRAYRDLKGNIFILLSILQKRH